MTDRVALENLAFARTDASSWGRMIVKSELLDDVVAEFRAGDPETGKPAGTFSQSALDVLLPLLTATREEVSRSVVEILPGIIEEIRANLWTGGDTPQVIDLAKKGAHEVFLTKGHGFAVDAQGTPAADVGSLGDALFHAGEWVQACFKSNENLFERAALDIVGKHAVIDQFAAQLDGDLSSLNEPQLDQLLGNIAGLTAELIKSVAVGSLAPVSDGERRQLIDDAVGLLQRVLEDERLGVHVRYQLVGYLHDSTSFRSRLGATQIDAMDAMYRQLNPEYPFDYAAWDAAGKDTIVVDGLSGGGEGFLYGFGRWLQERGLGNSAWQNGHNRLELVSGSLDDDVGPAQLRVTVPAADPINAWGRDMTVIIDLSRFQNNMMRGLGRQGVDITGYDGHSEFGRATSRSMRSTPEQKGEKLFYRFVCAGVDKESLIARRAPRAYTNSYTTQDSGFFRRRAGGPDGGEYAYEAEGWEGIRCLIRGALGKKSHLQIQADMKAHANWWGHSPGNDNNFVGPGDKRRGGSGDWDNDAIPNMYDVMPTVNTFDVEASVQHEFELELPDVPAGQINGFRAFQAIQFADTATNYSTLIKSYNLNRNLNAHPDGVFFDAREDPNAYLHFEQGTDGKLWVQFSSALSDMTEETLRAVLCYELSRHLLEENHRYDVPDHASVVAASLLFAMASLEYDDSYRDRAIFAGLGRLYNIPASVDFDIVDEAQYGAEDRHNYTGDTRAMREILDATGDALAADNVGIPSLAVDV